MRTFKLFSLLAGMLVGLSPAIFGQSPKTIAELAPTIWYDFESDDFTAAKAGLPLEFYTIGENNTIGTPLAPTDPQQPNRVPGPNPSKKAVEIPRDVNVKITNNTGIVPLQDYTLLYDIECYRFESNDFGRYHCLLQTIMENNGDGDIFLRNNLIGLGSYSSKGLLPFKWTRIIVVHHGEGDYRAEYYFDGEQVHQHSMSASVDDILDFFWIFTDNDGEDLEQNIANFALWDRALSPEEVAALGDADVVGTTPYGGTPQQVPGTVEAEYFDEGGNGASYYAPDKTQGGAKNSIRTDVDLPIRYDEGSDQTYIILPPKSFVQYTLDVTEDGFYNIYMSYSGTTSEATLYLYIDESRIPLTLLEQDDWSYAERNGIDISAGLHTIQLIWLGEEDLKIGDLWIDVGAPQDVVPTLSYDFEDPNDLTKPTDGELPLEFYRGTGSGIGEPNPTIITQANGPTPTDKAAYIPLEGRAKIYNPLGPSVTGKRLSTYSLMFEYMVYNISEYYHTFYQDLEENNADAAMFIKPNNTQGAIGITGTYTSPPNIAEDGKWQRVIFSFNDGVLTTFVDGKIGFSGSWDIPLGDYFWLFTDNDNEDNEMWVSRVAFWANVALGSIDLKRAGIDGGITGIKPVGENSDRVYAANGKLFFEGISGSASAEIYSSAGQKIASIKSINDKSVSLPAKGLYIVKVTDNGRISGHKVINH
jgi:hypothetical protein